MAEPVLELKNVNKKFEDQVIFENFNLSVNEGEAVVIVGPSGCGKSTLLRCMNGLEEIQSGEILVDGKNASAGSSQKIGMVFQSYDLFPHLRVLDK